VSVFSTHGGPARQARGRAPLSTGDAAGATADRSLNEDNGKRLDQRPTDRVVGAENAIQAFDLGFLDCDTLDELRSLGGAVISEPPLQGGYLAGEDSRQRVNVLLTTHDSGCSALPGGLVGRGE
jgi:hypothetical protein